MLEKEIKEMKRLTIETIELKSSKLLSYSNKIWNRIWNRRNKRKRNKTKETENT